MQHVQVVDKVVAELGHHEMPSNFTTHPPPNGPQRGKGRARRRTPAVWSSPPLVFTAAGLHTNTGIPNTPLTGLL